MSAILEKMIAGMGKGLATSGEMNLKSQIMADRDARLQKYQTGEREAGQKHQTEVIGAGQKFKTDERVAGEDFKQGESVLDRQATITAAEKRSGGGAMGKVVGKEFIGYDGIPIDIPMTKKNRDLLAMKNAAAEISDNKKLQASGMSEGPIPTEAQVKAKWKKEINDTFNAPKPKDAKPTYKTGDRAKNKAGDTMEFDGKGWVKI